MKLALLPKQTRGGAVNASIRLNFGDERSLKDTDRASGLASAMLMRGTKSKTREQIQDTLDKLQSQMNVGGAGGVVAVSIVSTRENLPAVLDLAIEVLREPAFPESELETLRSSDLAELEASKSEPQAVVSRAYGRHWNPYPKGDVRYIPTVDEERDDLTKVSVKELRDFYSGFYGASNAEVSVVGDFDADAIRDQIAKKLDGWKSPKAYADVLTPFPDPPIAPTNEVFQTPDKENAFFLAGMPLPLKDSDADYPALVLGNYILGSGPSSRLFSRIREPRGPELRRRLAVFRACEEQRRALHRASHLGAAERAKGRGVVPRRARERAARRLQARGGRDREEQLGAAASDRTYAGRRARGRAARAAAQRPHDGVGRGPRVEGPRADARADPSGDAEVPRPGEDDVTCAAATSRRRRSSKR